MGRALCSLSWCDELLVLDSGSTDNTREVSESHNAKFLTHIQSSPFLISEQRNWALSNCSLESEWVLFLDADEEISDMLAYQIINSLSDSRYDAYELTPRYWFLGKWLKRTQGYPNWHPRLVRRGCNQFTGGVWEAFANPNRVGRIRIPYEHYAFSKGIEDWLERHIRYSRWESDYTYKMLSGTSPSAFDTPRFKLLRILQARFWILRPFLRFSQKYILQLGFMEGWQGLIYSVLISFYDTIVVIKVIEKYFHQKGKQL